MPKVKPEAEGSVGVLETEETGLPEGEIDEIPVQPTDETDGEATADAAEEAGEAGAETPTETPAGETPPTVPTPVYRTVRLNNDLEVQHGAPPNADQRRFWIPLTVAKTDEAMLKEIAASYNMNVRSFLIWHILHALHPILEQYKTTAGTREEQKKAEAEAKAAAEAEAKAKRDKEREEKKAAAQKEREARLNAQRAKQEELRKARAAGQTVEAGNGAAAGTTVSTAPAAKLPDPTSPEAYQLPLGALVAEDAEVAAEA